MQIPLLALVLVFTQGIPSINDTVIIKDWQCLGPFSVGAREGVIGVEPNIDDWSFSPVQGKTYPSILVQGGEVSWRSIIAADANVEIKYDEIEWDTLQNIYGIAGLLCVSYAYGEFQNVGENRALVSAMGASSFTLNGIAYPGDAYNDGYALIPVILVDGKNRVVVKLSGFAGHNFSFKIIPVADHIMIVSKDITLPDVVKNEKFDGFVGVPVVNTTEKRLKDIALEITGDDFLKTVKTITSLMPLSAVKVPIQVKLKTPVQVLDSLALTVTATCGDLKTNTQIWLKVKDSNEVYARTFISNIDNSCQYYAVQPPKNFSAESIYALIITCHGAGVEARGQAAAYLQKDWAYVVAPTNRRRYGFDWQDWGRLDFLEVLAEAKKNFKVDENRVCLAGHSMGGHGVWHIGLSHPDLFAAIAPSAGWSSFPLYIPWFLQKSEIFGAPEILKYRDMVMREDNPLLFVENATNLPIYILQGGADDNVPPIQARMFAEELTKQGMDFTYNEVPGMGHWWNNDSTPGTDCVDLEEMMGFLKNKVRNKYPTNIVFKTSDLAQSNQCFWVRIDELENNYSEGEIKAEIVYNTIDVGPVKDEYGEIPVSKALRGQMYIKLSNVKRFTLFGSLFRTFVDSIAFSYGYIYINGVKTPCEFQNEISFLKIGDSFSNKQIKVNSLTKVPSFYGPIKRAFFTPFVLVYGTTGDSLATQSNLHMARLLSYTWWTRANGFVEIVPDTEVTSEHIKNYNLILFGNAETNAFIKKINEKLPIHFNKDYWALGKYIKYIRFKGLIKPYENMLFVGKKIQREKDLCMMEIYPNPLNQKKFILLYSATTKKAMKYAGLFSTLYSGAGLPDFIVWDESAAKYGWGGVVCAGFFDNKWQLDKSLMYVKD